MTTWYYRWLWRLGILIALCVVAISGRALYAGPRDVLPLRIGAPLSADARVYTWQSGLQRIERTEDDATLYVRLMRECWQVVVIDGAARHEWLDPECAVLAPRATVYGVAATGVRIQWQAPYDYPLACFLRVRGNQLLGCTREQVYQHGPGSIDAAMVLVPGDVIEVRAYDETGAFISMRVVYGNVWLPLARR